LAHPLKVVDLSIGVILHYYGYYFKCLQGSCDILCYNPRELNVRSTREKIKMRYIEELRENEHVIEHYLCKQKQSLKTRAGKTYYSLRLIDKTGIIDAKIWELSNDIANFEEGDMIKIDASVVTFQNDLQLKINKLRRSRDGEYALEHYIPMTDHNIDDLYNEVLEYIKTINHAHIRQMMENILVNDTQRVEAFKARSAAKSMHHAYMGGLLEHTLSVVKICDFMSTRYRYINRDVLIASALLHDIGKIYELSAMPMNDYTDDGQMLGHIVIGSEMVAVESSKIEGFPHDAVNLIKHCIIAHHGEYEYGSPKLPCTAEAILLHYADNMDAKLKSFEEALDADKTPGPWAGFHKAFGRMIRRSLFTN